MHRYHAEGQLNEFNVNNDCELSDDEFTEEEINELSSRIQQLYGDSLENIAHQFDTHRNA